MIFKKLFGKQEKLSVEAHELEEPERYYFPKSETDIAMLKTTIAGITHHMTMADARKPYQGHTVFEPDNPVDKKAIKLVTDDGKMMGYISAADQSLYYSIFEGKDKIRFYGAVGIFTNDNNKKSLFGKIMLVDIPDSTEHDRLFDLAQKQLDFMMSDFSSE